MGEMVIVAYRPRPGKHEELLTLVRTHVPFLRRLGLATDRPALAMRGADGVIIEVFEWQRGAIATAHENEDVLELWRQFDAVCEYVPLAELPESAEMFAQFEPL